VFGFPEPPLPLGDVQIGDVWSNEVQDTFRLFVGRCGDDPEAVLLVADANGLFGLAVDTVRLMQLPALVPAMLVVGVGYPTARTIADTVTIRVRDLTPTTSASFPGSGGADTFLRFIRDEIFRWLERDHPACLAQSIYFGHSLGGLLGVHALLSEPPTFDHHILSSPSLWWDHHRLFDQEQQQASAGGRAGVVYFGIGADETDEGRRREGANLPDGHPLKPARTHLDMVDDLIRFVDALRQRSNPNIEIEAVVFADEYHATVAGTVLSHGLRHIFERH
jgi:predicted alpha/beta superfamily hydrolase